MEQINDFGEKLNGAKKDIATFRKNGGIRADEIADWDEDTRSTFITKRDVFPTPQYQQLYNTGEYAREALFFAKKVRDSLSNEPQLGKVKKQLLENPESAVLKRKVAVFQDNYVKNLNMIQDYLLTVKTKEDVFDASTALKEFYNDKIKVPEEASFITKKLKKTLDMGNKWGYTRLIAEMKEAQFLFTQDEKILANFTIGQYHKGDIAVGNDLHGGNILSIKHDWGTAYYYHVDDKYVDFSNWKDGTYFVINSKKGTIAGFGFESREKAEEFVLSSFSKGDVKTQPANEKRCFSLGKLDKIERTCEDYLGSENATGELMMNEFGFRAGQFGESSSQTEKQSNMNMAYEAFKDLARVLKVDEKGMSLGGKLALSFGARPSSSAAHYELETDIINLARTSGAGALGHVWAHAFDHYIAEKMNRAVPYESIKGKNGLFNEVMWAIKFYDGGTKFYKDAQAMDKVFAKSGKDCWSSNKELFARAFHVYLLDKISPQKSDYLCGHAETLSFEYKGQTCFSYPVGRERERIVKAFDNLFEICKERGFFEKPSATPKDCKIGHFEKIAKEAIERFNEFFKCDDSENATNYLYDLSEIIEAYDKNSSIDTSELISGAMYLEERGAYGMHDIRDVLNECMRDIIKSCSKLNIGYNDKMFLSKRISELTRGNVHQMCMNIEK